MPELEILTRLRVIITRNYAVYLWSVKIPRKYCNSGIKIYTFLVFCWIHLRIEGKVGEIRESLSFTDSADVTPIPIIINDVMAPSPRA